MIYECQWKKQLKLLQNVETTQFPSILSNESNEKILLNGIKNGTLFGYIKCSVRSPDSFIKSKIHCNFPPIIRKLDIDESMISPYMKTRCEARKTKLPFTTLAQTYHAIDILLFSPLAKFYLELGLELYDVSYFIQYQPFECLKKFTEKVTSMRMDADRNKNEEKSVTAKLVGNRYLLFLDNTGLNILI